MCSLTQAQSKPDNFCSLSPTLICGWAWITLKHFLDVHDPLPMTLEASEGRVWCWGTSWSVLHQSGQDFLSSTNQILSLPLSPYSPCESSMSSFEICLLARTERVSWACRECSRVGRATLGHQTGASGSQVPPRERRTSWGGLAGASGGAWSSPHCGQVSCPAKEESNPTHTHTHVHTHT